MSDLYERHNIDGMGLPSGGMTSGKGFMIDWGQASEIDILRTVASRERWLQSGVTLVVPDPRVANAIEHIEKAVASLREYDAREYDVPREGR